MTEHDKADEARKGLVDSVKGKAKEIAGAVTGNDSLTAEGQLQQTEAEERRAAGSAQAEAEAEAARAESLVNEARIEGAEQRIAVDAQTAAAENAARSEQANQKLTAEEAG